MTRRQGQAPFLSGATFAGFAAVWLLLAQFLGFILDAIPSETSSVSAGLSLLLSALALSPLLWLNIYRSGWRKKQTRLNDHFEEVVAQGRPYMLYLRPFVTSGRIKAPNDWPHFGQRVLLGDPWELELALATVIGTDTPLVAIGDTRGGFGAAKLKTTDEEWRKHMQRLAHGARLVIAVPLDRPSTLWEMEEVRRDTGLLKKAVFVMPPSSHFFDALLFLFRRSIASRWRRAAKQLKEKGLILPRYSHRGGFFVLGEDGHPSKLAGFRYFKPTYVDGLLTDVSADGVSPPDRVAWFNQKYGGPRWLRPRLLGGMSLLGLYSPQRLKLFVLFTLFWMVFSTLAFHLRSIPSESMLPALQVGDRVAISNLAYGYNRNSLLFGMGPVLIPDDPANPDERILGSTPRRGDIVVFQHTHNDRVMIKRIVGLPGDTVQMKEGRLYLNGQLVERMRVRETTYLTDDGAHPVTATEYREQLPGEKQPHLIHEFSDDDRLDETPEFKVPQGNLFMMGDNRDNSEDSRAPSGHRDLVAKSPESWSYTAAYLGDPRDDAIGFVPLDHLIGRVETVFFSLHSCRKAPGAECLPSNVWKEL
jgi:signal peptidase I